LVDIHRQPPYLAVFEQTDAFDTTYLSVLEKEFNQAKSDTLRFALINDLAYYWHTRNLATALAFAKKGLAMVRNRHNGYWEGRLQVTQGAILLRAEKLDSAEIVLQQARGKVQPRDLPLLLTQLGYVMERRGMLSQAADYALESLQVGEQLKDQRAIALAYSDLSNLFWKQSKFQKGLEYGLRAEEVFRKRGIKDMDYSFTLYIVGNNYLTLKDYPKALLYYQGAIAMSEQYGFYNNLADAYISLIDLYTATNAYPEAEKAAEQAIRYATLLDNNFLLMRAWLSVGKLQNLTKRPQLAIQSLKTCLQVATAQFGDEFFLNQVYKELGKAYVATGDYQRATEALLTYDQLKDRVFTAEADRRVAELQTRFEVAQKEATIRTQQTTLRQQNRLQLLASGIAGLLVIILAGLTWSYRTNQRTSSRLQALNTDLASKNSQLDKRNAENELLLKEIHHRVKNNLEVVSSLLALQSAHIADPDVQAAMQASQNRVQSMGILHQKLYQGEQLAFIEMKNYFVNLSENILDSYNETDRITVDFPMPPLELDVDTAVPVGLIVNELLTNSLKYAFPQGKAGKVLLSLTETDKGMLQLRVADNGIGQATDARTQGTGFGTQLVSLLTRQLEGTMQQDSTQGTLISIQFKKTRLA
jgi:two-component sensor histidine kinase